MSEYQKMAIRNIAKTGDTDIFPFPIEKYMFEDKSAELEKILEDLDNDYDQICQNLQIDTIQVSLPVGYTGYRWATQIDPVWNAFYLAEVLKIAGQIEQKRIAIDQSAVFSYRFKYEEESGKLFDSEVGWRGFYESAREKSEQFKYVVMFDISDFYGRISHECLKDVLLKDIGADADAVNRILGLLGMFAHGEDKLGLPIGGNASRILAEGLMVRTDSFMREQGITFCRFVDDIIFFAESPEDAYRVLNICADYFFRELRLSLQKQKTVIMTKSEFGNHTKSIINEIQTDEEKLKGKDKDRSAVMKLTARIDPYSLAADETIRDLKESISGEGVLRLLRSECRKTRVNQMFGKQLLRVIRVLDEKEKSEAFNILSKNFVTLYPLFPLIMRTARHLLPLCTEKTRLGFLNRVKELFETDSFIVQTENNAAYALRVLSLANDKAGSELIRKVYEKAEAKGKNEGMLVRVNALYAMINLKELDWVKDKMQDFSILPARERRALIAAEHFLKLPGESLGEQIKKECSPFENLVADWVSWNMNERTNWKLPL